jgi:hypothetical protein
MIRLDSSASFIALPGLDPGIHEKSAQKFVDGRVKPGQSGQKAASPSTGEPS